MASWFNYNASVAEVLSICTVVTFSSHSRWILGAKTSRKCVHCKICLTCIFWPDSIQFFCLRLTHVVVSAFKFLYLAKNVHIRHRILNEHKLQLIIFGSILNSSDVSVPVTLQQMDVSVSFKPMDATASAGSIENGGRLRICHGVNNISHVCWSDVKLTTKFKFKFVTDANTSGRVHVMDQTDDCQVCIHEPVWLCHQRPIFKTVFYCITIQIC